MQTDNYTLGAYIRAARKRAGLDQIELAHKVGVSQAKVSGWECGRTRPDVLEWVAIAEATLSPTLLDLSPFSVTVPVTTGELAPYLQCEGQMELVAA